MYNAYQEVFQQQERKDIIEEIFVPPPKFDNYIWIPHYPVIKSDTISPTKIKPVFNCSYKIKFSLSVNEAAYPGVHLMGDMLDLLLLF